MKTPRWLVILGATATIGLVSAPALAEQRTITIELLGGKLLSLTLDVPPGTPLQDIQLPAALAPIATIKSEVVPTTTTTTEAAPTVTVQEAAQAAAQAQKQHRKPAKKAVAKKTVAKKQRTRAKAPREIAGGPSAADPTFSYALPGPAAIGVPNFFIENFRIPPFLLPIYQAAGSQYGVRWEILAAINEIETDYGRNLSISTAGAEGWMQFMPATWAVYGTDANGDGVKDPYNPVDAIFSAARYLDASGAHKSVRNAIFSYNHADWYVDSVLMRARLVAGLPADLVGSLTGLTEGRFPVAAASQYVRGSTAALNIYARKGARVIAVQDGKVTRIGRSDRLGRFVRIRDAFGNTYTYGRLGKVASTYRVTPVPSHSKTTVPAISRGGAAVLPKLRLFAHPQPAKTRARLRVGSRVMGGTTLGTLGGAGEPHVRFQIRPAGKGAPLIDPKPILDGWKLLESTAIYRAAGRNPLLGHDPTPGQILLMSKAALRRSVLADKRIDLYPGGRDDIRAGLVDRRVLAVLAYLSANGLKPTVSSLRSNHSIRTKSGSISAHSTGNAVDISKINGVSILGHQGAGSIADLAVRRLLTLQGAMKPDQIISLMTYSGAPNTLALPDHANHIHIGFSQQADMLLKPSQWTRLLDRLGSIANPEVQD